MPPSTLRPWPISRHGLASGSATRFPPGNFARSRSDAVGWRQNMVGLPPLNFAPPNPAQQCVELYHGCQGRGRSIRTNPGGPARRLRSRPISAISETKASEIAPAGGRGFCGSGTAPPDRHASARRRPNSPASPDITVCSKRRKGNTAHAGVATTPVLRVISRPA
jgi:hypothetical protein